MNPVCTLCEREQDRPNAAFCDYCGQPTTLSALPGSKAVLDKIAEVQEIAAELLKKAEAVSAYTLPDDGSGRKFKVVGLVCGTSSKQAFWGLSTQADRLTRAYQAALVSLKYEAVLLKADAVVGVTVAVNNSTGSGNALLTGSSEAVMLLGTAIKFETKRS